MSKPTLYVDCDDTVLESSETVIKILNKRYGLDKTIDDLRDWNYKSIVKGLSQEELYEIYESDEFWDDIRFKLGFLSFFNENCSKYDWVFVSLGTEENLKRKRELIFRTFPPVVGIDVKFVGLDVSNGFSKKEVDMRGGIFIDDNMRCFEGTNAACNILVKSDRPHYWNEAAPCFDNLYEVNNWDDIETVLDFFWEHPEFVEKTFW